MTRYTRTKGRACDGKKAHESRAVALRHVQRLIRRGAAANAYEPYSCGPHWHVGHRPRKDRR